MARFMRAPNFTGSGELREPSKRETSPRPPPEPTQLHDRVIVRVFGQREGKKPGWIEKRGVVTHIVRKFSRLKVKLDSGEEILCYWSKVRLEDHKIANARNEAATKAWHKQYIAWDKKQQ